MNIVKYIQNLLNMIDAIILLSETLSVWNHCANTHNHPLWLCVLHLCVGVCACARTSVVSVCLSGYFACECNFYNLTSIPHSECPLGIYMDYNQTSDSIWDQTEISLIMPLLFTVHSVLLEIKFYFALDSRKAYAWDVFNADVKLSFILENSIEVNYVCPMKDSIS